MDCQRRSREDDIRLCRLQKHLAACGLGSRRACEALIEFGRVTVDGVVVSRLGACVDPSAADVRVDGKPVRPEKGVHILWNKPPGVLITCRDPHHRRTFADFLPGLRERVYPVGRLDKDSEGALVLTNDGALANALTHPRHHVEKTYCVWVTGLLDASQEKQMRAGVRSEGETLRAAGVALAQEVEGKGCYTVVLREGRKREIRRMFAGFGLQVLRLQRTAIGPLRLGGLRLGRWRLLAPREVEALRQASGLAPAGAP